MGSVCSAEDKMEDNLIDSTQLEDDVEKKAAQEAAELAAREEEEQRRKEEQAKKVEEDKLKAQQEAEERRVKEEQERAIQVQATLQAEEEEKKRQQEEEEAKQKAEEAEAERKAGEEKEAAREREEKNMKDIAKKKMITFLSMNNYPVEDVNAKKKLNNFGRFTTPLFEAVEKNDKDLVQSLLNHGADRTVVSKKGRTPLDKANKLNAGGSHSSVIAALSAYPKKADQFADSAVLVA